MWFPHSIRDRYDQPNSLKAEYRSANHESEVLRVEHLHMRCTVSRHYLRFRSKNVDQASDDEGVCNEGGHAESAEIPDQCQRKKNDGLDEDEVWQGQNLSAICQGCNECLTMSVSLMQVVEVG